MVNIPRLLLLGGTGSGKTITAVDYIKEYYELGFVPYSNQELFNMDYYHIEDMNFIDDIDDNENNVVYWGEAGELGKGYYQTIMGQLIAQSRKSIGENHVFIMDGQVRQQTNSLIRGMFDYIQYPFILTRYNKVPVHVRLLTFKRDLIKPEPTFYYVGNEYRNVYEAGFCYETKDMVNKSGDGRFKKYLKMYVEYVGTSKKIKDLTTIIHKKHGENKSDSDMFARQIIHALDWDMISEKELQELMNKVNN